jgi:hypothetical protein
MGAWLPYRCARRFLSAFFPIGDDPPWHETIRRRTIRVGAGLERKTLSRAKTPRAVPPLEAMTLLIDAGHVLAVRGHQVRTFEVMACRSAFTMESTSFSAACPAKRTSSARS